MTEIFCSYQQHTAPVLVDVWTAHMTDMVDIYILKICFQSVHTLKQHMKTQSVIYIRLVESFATSARSVLKNIVLNGNVECQSIIHNYKCEFVISKI